MLNGRNLNSREGQVQRWGGAPAVTQQWLWALRLKEWAVWEAETEPALGSPTSVGALGVDAIPQPGRARTAA